MQNSYQQRPATHGQGKFIYAIMVYLDTYEFQKRMIYANSFLFGGYVDG
jgi:hypothetical protein